LHYGGQKTDIILYLNKYAAGWQDNYKGEITAAWQHQPVGYRKQHMGGVNADTPITAHEDAFELLNQTDIGLAERENDTSPLPISDAFYNEINEGDAGE
jgi:hypothetical protein